jgi:selenocysteine-specific translation elongation factor
MQVSNALLVRIESNPLYQGRISKKMVVNAAIGMPIAAAQIIPFEVVKGVQIVLDEVKTTTFDAALVLQRPIAIDESAKVLLLRTDLPPNQMRIIGSGTIVKIERKIILSKRKVRVGKVQRIRDDDVLVEGLASTRGVAESIVGGRVSSTGGVEGIIKSAFGTRGVVSIAFDDEVQEDDNIQYERLVEEDYSFGPR